MDLSVLIVTRNTCSQTLQAIDSVFQSADPFEKEVIVVDNGSSDDTVKMIALHYPQATCLKTGRNLGFARAINLAATQAKGAFLLLLNSDTQVQPETLAEALTWMRHHPECGVAGAQLLNPDGSRQNSIANLPNLATELLNKSLLRWLFPKRFPGKELQFSQPLQVESVVGAFLLTRRETWNKLNGLDERYFFFFEETDFCLQTKRAGWGVFHLPQVKVWHGQGQTAKTTPAAARIEYWRSRYIYFRKHFSLSTLAILRLGLAVRLAADWLAALLMTILTLGTSVRWKQKLFTHSALVAWHCQGCPDGPGLPR